MVYVDHFENPLETPTWAKEIVETMGKAHLCVFIGNNDLTIFVGKLAEMLVKDKPKNCMAHVEFKPSDQGSGKVAIMPNGTDNQPIAYLRFTKVKAVLEYDDRVMDFFDVSERLANPAKNQGI